MATRNKGTAQLAVALVSDISEMFPVSELRRARTSQAAKILQVSYDDLIQYGVRMWAIGKAWQDTQQ